MFNVSSPVPRVRNEYGLGPEQHPEQHVDSAKTQLASIRRRRRRRRQIDDGVKQ